MLARIESYKKITDHEVEALKQDLSRQLAEEKNKMSQTGAVLANLGRAYLGIIADLMPWAPIEQRKKIVESAVVPDDFKAPLLNWAERAPDLSTAVLEGRVSKLLQAYRDASMKQ
jgi:hypothetical protein